MTRHPWDRLAAWLVDWLCVLAWVAVTAAVGVPLFLAGLTRGLSTGALNVIATVLVVVPATSALAWFESSAREATIGKRARRLRVVDANTGARISFRRALLRNTVKIAVPWMIGHAVVFGIVQSSATDSMPVWSWVATAAAYVLPVVYVVSLFVGRGRTPYDRIVGSDVVRQATGPAPRGAAPLVPRRIL